MSDQKKLNRRDFIKGAAMSGAGLAAIGVMGATSSTAVASSLPSPQSSDIPSVWDEETDVIVVGTGVAGYAAAIEAKDAGADVLIIEKEDWVGGNSLLAGGNMQFPVNHVQEAAGIEDKPEWAYEDYMISGDYRNNPDIVRQFVDNSADTALWLERLGIVWSTTVGKQDGCRVPRTLIPTVSPNYPQSRGLSEVFILNAAAVDRGIPVKTGYRMTAILRPDSKSPVAGIQVIANGQTINIRARKAVVLATGGFKANHQMIRALDPRLDEPFPWSGSPYVNTIGDGHFAAAAIGASFVDMSFVCEFNFTIGSDRYVVWEPQTMDGRINSGGMPFSAAALPRVILVDNDGNRYSNEAKFTTGHVTWKSEHLNAYLSLPKRPRASWMVADADGATALGWTAERFQYADPNNAPFLDPKYVAIGNTIEELAENMGVPAAGLKTTVEKYNGFTEAGADEDFKRPAPLTSLTTAPFFAARTILGTHDQCAGMRVNAAMQVIDSTFQQEMGTGESVALSQERIIPKLYAAGEVTGGLFGADRGAGKMGAYVVQGRDAGKNAAKESPAS